MGGRGCTRCSWHGPNTHCPCHHNPFGANTAHPTFKQILNTMSFIPFHPLPRVHSFSTGAGNRDRSRPRSSASRHRASPRDTPVSWDLGAEQEVNRKSNQLEFCRLHHRQVRGLRALEDAAGINPEFRPSTLCGLTPPFHPQPPAPAGAHDDIGGFFISSARNEVFCLFRPAILANGSGIEKMTTTPGPARFMTESPS